MEKNAKIYVAGHMGLVGSAVVRRLQEEGYTNLILRSRKELDLLNQQAVRDFFEKEKPELLGYLRGHLHNHDITIEVVVNESAKSKIAFTAQDKFNRLNEINPNLEELRKIFDLLI